MINNKHIVRAV